ncbi:PepSY domain-containing protein [Psychrobacter frigidicola]|uniref:PepSY domain-containing protein n=1 Tax=Psychrobacter frigidicola TaxID=45611 RepID=A0A5C7AAH2_9GAMM|nr:PepSY domain-containing protein [Psychrobacter frigidicola]TXD97823.1 PepSY domain-containing protein [Psychrobacter frigidicola]
MSLPLLKPLLLTVGATSLVFFGGVIALSTQSPDVDNVLSVTNPITQPQSTQPSSLAALTAAQANELAKQNAPDAILQATPELINYNGTAAYEVLLDSGATYIDANLGTVLNPVATNNDYVEDDDDDYKDKRHDDDKHKSDKHHSKKHDDEDYKEKGRLITTSYQQHNEDGFDEDSYDD